MRVSKRQLRRIIKEEKRKLLRESFASAGLNVRIETIGKNVHGEPLPLPQDIHGLAFDLEQHLKHWAQSLGVNVSVSAGYQS